MNPLTIILENWRLALVLVVAAALFSAGWKVREWKATGELQALKAEHQALLTDLAEANAQAMKDAAQRYDELERSISSIDKVHTEEIERARLENQNLRDCIRTGRCRLSVPTKTTACNGSATGVSSAGGPGVGATEARTELDGKTADDLVAIANDGDEAIRQLNACTAIIESLTGGQP